MKPVPAPPLWRTFYTPSYVQQVNLLELSFLSKPELSGTSELVSPLSFPPSAGGMKTGE